MNKTPLTYSSPPSKLLTARQHSDLVYCGFYAAEKFFNGDWSLLQKCLDDQCSPDKRTAAAGNRAARAGIFWSSYLLWITSERGIATFTPPPPSPWDFNYIAAKSEASIWRPDCAHQIVAAVNALRRRLPGVYVSYEVPPPPSAEKAPPTPPAAPPPAEADKVQKIEIVAMPAQQVAITQMPPPGPLKVSIDSMPSTESVQTVERHPNSDEITKVTTKTTIAPKK